MSDVRTREIIDIEEDGAIEIGEITPYYPDEALDTDEGIAYFMAEAFNTGDVGFIAHALGIVARAKGMTQIAKETGLSREQLYRSLSEGGNPTLRNTLAVMKALGVGITTKVVEKNQTRAA